ncbi:MAG: glycosyl hydrolase-related protein [Planctomycetota bacterium]|nr:glycosyl hydrolase-related protein [Planctomycetota bacterium]
MKKKPVLYILTNNHFDPTWRRCWDRRFTDSGRTFVSYAELEDYYLTDNLAIARKHSEYKFEAESTVVARKYLERHPEKLKELRRLAAARRFAVTGAGENIVDSNMVLGESLVRNFLLGLLWVEETLGVRTKLGVRNDAFGNSAQIPQVFRGCEIEWVTGFSYSPCRKEYWRGLDGSILCCANVPVIGSAREAAKCRPCSRCLGKGCRACRNRGIEPTPAVFPEQLDLKRLRERGCGLISMGYEENLPNPEVIARARQLRGKYDVRFAVQEDFLAIPWLRDMVSRVGKPPAGELCTDPELNPNNSGTWVTRIKLKQMCRQQEYELLAAESLSTLAALRGAEYPRRKLKAAWRTLLFTMFHDAITATHVDAAYDELGELQADIATSMLKHWRRVSKVLVRPAQDRISVLNMTGGAATQPVAVLLPASAASFSLRDEDGQEVQVLRSREYQRKMWVQFLAKDVPPFGARVFSVLPRRTAPPSVRQLREPVIENERFRIQADSHGIVSVYDKRLKCDILKPGMYRPGELVLERDTGSPWATLEPDCSRMGLAEWTTLEGAQAAPVWQRLMFRVELPYSSKAAWARGWLVRGTVELTLHAGLERADCYTWLEWDSHNGRVRVAFPVPMRGKHYYGIPYGTLERKPYKGEFNNWDGANGDWPAINWSGVQAPKHSVALLNKGIPSYRMEEDHKGGTTMWLSLLRSPAVPTYLHEPQFYSMTAYDGMRDAGDHLFHYAITAYDKPFAASDVVNDAEGYNDGLIAAPGVARLPRAPQCLSDHVRISALKMAEQGGGLIIRLWEYRGQGGEVSVRLPDGVQRVSKVNLLERQPQPLDLRGGMVRFAVRPWEIATLLAEL